MKHIYLLFLALAACAPTSNITKVEPKGEFARIRVEPSYSITKSILRGDKNAAIKVLRNIGAYNPPAIAAASNRIFSDDPERAMYLFYLAQLRARSDADKAQDPSAKAGVSAMTAQYGPPINRYAFRNMPLLRRVVKRVVEDDKSIPRNYDPRWIALHGLDAFSKTNVSFAPKSQWNRINASARRNFYAGFKEVSKMMR